MIIQNVKIGDKEVVFSCSAGTLKRYKDIFGGDLLGQMSKLSSEDPDMDMLIQLAYVMAVQSGEKLEFTDWLDQFDLVDFVSAIPKIIAMWSKNNNQSAIPKKK